MIGFTQSLESSDNHPHVTTIGDSQAGAGILIYRQQDQPPSKRKQGKDLEC